VENLVINPFLNFLLKKSGSTYQRANFKFVCRYGSLAYHMFFVVGKLKTMKERELQEHQNVIFEWFESNRTIDFHNLDKTHYWYAKARTHDLVTLFSNAHNADVYRKILFSAFLSLQEEWKKTTSREGL